MRRKWRSPIGLKLKQGSTIRSCYARFPSPAVFVFLAKLGFALSMSRFHLVRVGAMGQVGRFAAVDAVRYPRHTRVVLRTRRGLEIGQVLSPPDERDALRLPDPNLSAAPAPTPATDSCLETPPPFSDQRPGRRAAAPSTPTAEPAEPIDEPPSDPDRVIDN